MLGVFAVAAGVIVLDVVAAAKIGTWWFLIPAMAVDVLMTVLVLGAVTRVMASDEEASDDR